MAQISTESIWLQLNAELRRFIRRRVSDEHVADDLLQETFVRIHRSLASLHDEERLAGWVHQIARNAIRDHYRSAATTESLAEDDVEDAPTAPLQRLQNQADQWLPELVHQLPELYREAIMLSEIEGLTQQEVADRLGISLSGAKSRIQRGRKLLREILGQCCAFQFDHSGRLMDCDPRSDRSVCRKCDEL